jgi:hypothetical protein
LQRFIVTRFLILAGLCLAFPHIARAESPDGCRAGSCTATYQLVAASDRQGYGLLLAAPETGCRRVRFRVEASGRVLGRTPSLKPGELGLVRLRPQFAAGAHLLSIAAEGCDTVPAAARRVGLAKTGPDHGWRAAEAADSLKRLK